MLRKYPHHLVDIREPDETFSAAEFREAALRTIDAIHAVGKIPLLVGGTGLYFRTLEQGIAELPEIPRELRAELREQCEYRGSKAMHAILEQIDPVSAARIHFNDPQRILRALEVFHVSGRNLTDFFHAHSAQAFAYRAIKLICAPPDKAALHEPISQRFESMLAHGFVNEVLKLKQNPRLTAATPALRAVGYRAVWQFLDGKKTRTQMVHDGVVATRRLAKRQYTWFRRENDATWIDSYAAGSFAQISTLINREVFSA